MCADRGLVNDIVLVQPVVWILDISDSQGGDTDPPLVMDSFWGQNQKSDKQRFVAPNEPEGFGVGTETHDQIPINNEACV